MTTPREDIQRLWAEEPGRFLFTATVMALLVFAAFSISVAVVGGFVWSLMWLF